MIGPMRILVIRPDAIGDVVLMMPLIGSIRRAYPDADIYTLQQPYTIPLTQHHPDIHAVIPDWKKMGTARGLWGFWSYVKHIRSYGFSMVFLPFNTGYYTALVTLAGIPFRIGDSNRLPLSPFLTHRIPQPFRNVMLHETELSARLIWAIRPDIPLSSHMHVPVTDAMKEAADSLMADHQLTSRRFVILHPSSGGGNRMWLKERYAQLIDELGAKGISVVLTGATPQDIQRLADIRALSQQPVIDLGGKTSLEALIGLVHHAGVVVGTDTGPTHIAAAVGTPVVSIAPSKFVKPLRWGPWATPHQVVSHSFSCHLWCKPGCKKNDCLTPIQTDEVLAAIGSLWPQAPSVMVPVDRREWLKRSVSHMVYVTQVADIPLAVAHVDGLRQWGAEVMLSTHHPEIRRLLAAHAQVSERLIHCIPRWQWWRWCALLIRYDIGCVYLPRPSRMIRVLRHLSALGQYVPPVTLSLTHPFDSESAWMAHLMRAFQHGHAS